MGLSGKARDFNWHNAMGFWAAVPLVVLTATAAVMSYSWANDLLYRAAGEKPPAARRAEAPRPAGKPAPLNLDGVEALWQKAEAADKDWRTITMRMAGPRVSFQVDAGSGGQPQLRQTLVFARSGEMLERETFDSLTAGRRARSWARFLHTGEALGLAGQTIAGAASMVGVVLVWTGLALALRRFAAWRKRSYSVVVPPTRTGAHDRTLTAA